MYFRFNVQDTDTKWHLFEKKTLKTDLRSLQNTDQSKSHLSHLCKILVTYVPVLITNHFLRFLTCPKSRLVDLILAVLARCLQVLSGLSIKRSRVPVFNRVIYDRDVERCVPILSQEVHTCRIARPSDGGSHNKTRLDDERNGE